MPKHQRPSRATKRNPIARSLRSGHLRPRVVPSKKTYTRRSRTPQGQSPNERT
jgi:hypothetical protein